VDGKVRVQRPIETRSPKSKSKLPANVPSDLMKTSIQNFSAKKIVASYEKLTLKDTNADQGNNKPIRLSLSIPSNDFKNNIRWSTRMDVVSAMDKLDLAQDMESTGAMIIPGKPEFAMINSIEYLPSVLIECEES
jgi:hypothetical protein